MAEETKKTTRGIGKKVYGRLGYDEQQTGLPDLEFMSELAPPEGLKKFRIMRRNDPIIGGLMLQLEGVMRRLRWEVKGANEKFVLSQLANIPGGLPGLIGEMASSFTYGFYIGEEVWGVRNGQVTLLDVEPRFQEGIQVINTKVTKDRGAIVEQLTDQGTFEIPYSKCLHHIFIQENRSPFGVSLLRHLYKPYYYKVAIEASEAIGVDRDLTGLPMLTAPEGFDFTAGDSGGVNHDQTVEDTLEWAVNLVSNIRVDQQQGIVKPFGWELELIRGERKGTVDTIKIIGRYNTEMAIGVLEGFLSMGAFASTNNANVEMHVSNFLTACDAYAISIAETVNQLSQKICKYNGLSEAPVINFSPARVANLTDLASFVARLASQQIIAPTVDLEKALLAIADLPYSDKAKKVVEPKKKK